ncbi:hypothetical protein ACIQF6_09970 [Kitasatospora sp. NPDC092948]|uniref:hypothetical protein n=1 Tax=Kitasatospora sp. NPDC092948 TaxID=3364088 RepID=UPI00381471CE
MAGGSWWREDGSADGSDGGDSVYAPPPAAEAPPERPAVPEQPAVPPKPLLPPPRRIVEVDRTPAPPPVAFDKPALPPIDFDLPPGPSPAEVDRAAHWAEGRGRADVTSVFPGWTEVYFDLPAEEPEPKTAPEPDPEPEPEEPAAPEQPRPGLAGRALRGLFGKPKPAPEPVQDAAPAAAGGARRPAPLLVLGALVLIGGAATGSLLAMLLGWGLAYLSSGLSDLLKKFAVLGIPLITVAGLTVWNWGREKGRWGAALAPGTDAGHATWAAAPGVLRVAAALTALFLLAVTLRRRKA